MKKLTLLTTIAFILTACAAPPATPSPTILPSPAATSTPAAKSTLTSTTIPTSTATPEPTATPTETPIPVFTLSGIIFFDYNGSGEQDAAYNMDGEENQEPGISGVPICVDANPSPLTNEQIEAREDCSVTGEDGSYSIDGIEAGSHEVFVVSPSDEPADAFRYINISHGWVDIPAYEMNDVQVPAQHLPDTEIQTIRTPIDLNISEDLILDVGLMQGYLVWPSTLDGSNVGTYQDLNLEAGCLTWLGNSDKCGDGHVEGIDIRQPVGTINISAAVGFVSRAEWTEMGYIVEINVQINNDDGGVEVAITYANMDSILLSEEQILGTVIVNVGTIIGTSGPWGSYPHLHFGHYRLKRASDGHAIAIEGYDLIAVDPYSSGVENLSFWTVWNRPQFPIIGFEE